MFKYLNVVIIFVILKSYSVSQITGQTAKSIALGSSGTIYSRGIDALSVNPANLSLDTSYHWSFTVIPNIHANIENNIFNFGIYEKYFSGIKKVDGSESARYLTNEDKEALLNLFPSDDRGEFFTNMDVNIFSITANYKEISGSLAFSIREKFIANSTIPKDALRLLLFGNPLNSQYSFNTFESFFLWLREFSLTYSRLLYKNKEMKIAGGINLKYLNGYAFGKIDKFNSTFSTYDTALISKINMHSMLSYSDFLAGKGKYSILGNTAGYGFALDLGFAFLIEEAYAFGLSMTNLGYLEWKKNVQEINIDTIAVITDVTNKDQTAELKNLIDNHKSNVNFGRLSLPFGFHLGMAISIHNLKSFKRNTLIPIILTSDFHCMVYPDLSWKTYALYSLGIEVKPISWLPLRTGFSIGSFPFALSFGFGVNTNNFEFDIGIGNIMFFTKNAKKISFGLGTLLKL
jgi:hypothetical protein